MINNENLSTVIMLAVVLFVCAPIIKSLLDYLIHKPKRVKVESQDIMQEVYKRRLRIARCQKPHDLKRITFLGDEDCHGASFKRIRGYVPDARMTEFFVKLRWYQWFPVWVIVPSCLVRNLVAGEVFIEARALRNIGIVYGVVHSLEHKHEEEKYRAMEHEYMNSLLKHETISFLQEERVNAIIAASSPGSIKEYWVGRQELSSSEQPEEEDVE